MHPQSCYQSRGGQLLSRTRDVRVQQVTATTRLAPEGWGLRECAGSQHDADASVPLHLRIRIRGHGVRVKDKAVGTSSDGSAASLGSSRETDTAGQPYRDMVIGSSGADRSSQHHPSGESLNAQEAILLSDARPSLASNGLKVSQGLAAVAGSRAHDAPKGKEARGTRRPGDFSLLGSWAPVVPKAVDRTGRTIPEKPSAAMLAYAAAPAQPPPTGMTCEAWLLSADQRR